MNRYLLLGIAALIAIGAWFAVPDGSVAASDEPLLVDGPPAQVVGKIHGLQLQQAFQRAPVAGEFEAYAKDFTSQHDESGPRREVVSLWRGDIRVLVVHIDVRRDGSSSAVAVTAELPSSPLTRQKALQPQDRAALARLTDMIVTDYISAVLQGRAPSDAQNLQNAFDDESGFSTKEHIAFTARVNQALKRAFGETAALPVVSASVDDPTDDSDAQSADAADGPNEPLPDAPVGEEPRPDDPEPDLPGD